MSTMPRFRSPFSFSLRAFLATLILLSLFGSNLYVSWKWRLAENENRRLRDELGVLTIDDPNRPCFISVPMTGDFTWRWRIYLPDQSKWSFYASTSEIPERGVPARSIRWLARTGEYTITARLQKNEDGKWMLAFYQPGIAIPMLFPPSKDDWLVDHRGMSVVAAGRRGTKSFGPDHEIVLLRVRAPTETGSFERQFSDGAMLWLEPDKSLTGANMVPAIKSGANDDRETNHSGDNPMSQPDGDQMPAAGKDGR